MLKIKFRCRISEPKPVIYELEAEFDPEISSQRLKYLATLQSPSIRLYVNDTKYQFRAVANSLASGMVMDFSEGDIEMNLELAHESGVINSEKLKKLAKDLRADPVWEAVETD